MSSDAEVLAGHRLYPTRSTKAQEDILARGRIYLTDQRAFNKLANDGWATLEQVAVAALHLGQLNIADECLTRLSGKFPASPRVDRLRGLALEAVGDEVGAQRLYDVLLEGDPTNVPIRKRRIAMARARGDMRTAVDELLLFVDTWYADVEAWLELADIYAECALYPQSLSALSNTLLLNPQNPFYVLRMAETAYTAQDVPLALNFFLRAVEMMGDAADESGNGSAGAMTRGWYGVKLCVRELLENPTLASPSNTPAPSKTNVPLLDELATERILAAYSTPSVRYKINAKKSKLKQANDDGDDNGSGIPPGVRGVVLKWLQGK